MVSLGFLNESNALTEKAKKALPSDLRGPPQEVADKTIILFHDESTFNQTKISPRCGLRKGQTLCGQNQKGVESWYSTLLMKEMGIYNSLMRSIQEQKKRTQQSESMRVSYSNMESQLKEAVKVAKANIPKKMVEELCGFLTTVVAILPCWMMPCTSPK